MLRNCYHHLGWHFGIDLFEAAFTNQTFARHTHEGFAIGAIVEGAGGYFCRGESVVLPAGSLSLMNPEEPHTGYSPAGCVRYNMLYVPETAVQAILGLTELRGFCAIAPQDKHLWLTQSLAQLASMLNSSKVPDWYLGVEEAIHNVLARAFVHYGRAEPRATGRELPAVSLTRDHITAAVDTGGEISLTKLADVVGLTPSYLIRCFRRATGITPYAYAMQIRIDCARHLMLRGTPAAEAAVAAGFYDQAHFIRRFRRKYGVTPGALMRH